MSFKYRKGNLSSTSSLQSLNSSIDTSVKEELLPQPSSLTECDDQFETYQILLQGKSERKADLIENLKHLRAEKEPLLKVKSALQEEISASNQLINTKSEEVTQIKHKLRHHSEKNIQDNIDRLEFQLRNNNYKPKEEQKILDEIFMLKKSFKSLREFDLKQKENKKYREERARLIEQRNEVFSKIQTIVLQEDEIRREVNELRHIINLTKKSSDHLKTLRPELEREFTEEQSRKKELKTKRQKEKLKARKEQFLMKKQERQKRWEEYEVSKEPYEEEKDVCKRLLAYLNSALPLIPSKTDFSDKETTSFCSNFSTLDTLSPSPGGNFYCKPEYSPLERVPSKKKKSREKRKEQKAGKKRELAHPPDVLSNLTKFDFCIPRTTEDIPYCIQLVEQKLEHFNNLSKGNEDNILAPKIENIIVENEKNADTSISSDFSAVSNSQSSLTKDSHPNSHLALTSSNVSCVSYTNNNSVPQCQSSSSSVSISTSNNNNNNNVNNSLNSENDSIKSHNSKCPDPNFSMSYFSLTVPVVSNTHPKETATVCPTYASVAAGIKV